MDFEVIKQNIFDYQTTTLQKLDNLYYLYVNDKDSCLEIINSLTSMYNYQPTHIIEELLTGIVLENKIDIITRIQILECIYLEKPILFYKLFYGLLEKIDYNDKNISLSILINSYIHILQVIEFEEDIDKNQIIYYFIKGILNNDRFEFSDKYKILVNLNKINKYYLQDFYLFFIEKYEKIKTKIPSRYKILASQYILQNCEPNIQDLSEKVVFDIMMDDQLDYNLRADACDLLLRLGGDTVKIIARDIIVLLGKEINVLNTIYTDKQNVHIKEIDSSIQLFLEKLTNIKIDDSTENIDQIQDILLQHTNDSDSVKGSILRIKLDSTLYGGTQNLNTIFIKIWQLINTDLKQYKSTLIDRINEELIDMFNTCSSGHLSRLVNILSGFTETINIGFRDQVKSNLFARLYKKIQNITIDGEYKESKIDNYIQKINMDKQELIEYQNNILEQLAITDYDSRRDLVDFFRRNLLPIRDELFKEFVPQYLDENTFEEYIIYSIQQFENP